MRRKPLTLIEVVVVVAIIGLLAALAIPVMLNARSISQRNECIANLTRIESAKEMWALANNKTTGDAVTGDMAALVGNYLKTTPVCAGGGSYVLGPVGSKPQCSKSASGHVM
jgi:prepilin-type N-terminal cleavage/methylation domain-containing protein